MRTCYLLIIYVLCSWSRKKGIDNNLMQIDVRASYPVKEIKLEEIAGIEYLLLELNEDFLYREYPKLITAKKNLVYSSYFLSAEKKLSPMIVRRPAIQSMEPAVILNSLVEAGNYQFMSVVPIKREGRNFPMTYLMRDKQAGSVYSQKITFNDYNK